MNYLAFAGIICLFFGTVSPTVLSAQFSCDLHTYSFFGFNSQFVASKMAFPVNHGKLAGYYNSNPFLTYSKRFGDKHLGVDINKKGEPNSDLGDTVYAIGRGKVIYLLEVTEGNDAFASVIMILHKTTSGYIVSQYRHCQKALVNWGEYVEYLQPISTIGTDFGVYPAHLHFEIRTALFKDIEGGYGHSTGYTDPMLFIDQYKQTSKKSDLPAMKLTKIENQ